MEVKKSSKADLESGRSQRFLLGLVVALACLFVAFEYTIDPDDPLDDPELMEQLSHEEELPPLLRPENELALAPKAEPAPTLKLKIVEDQEEAQQEEEEPQPLPDEAVEGDSSDDELPDADADEKGGDEVMSIQVVQDLPQFPGGPLEFIKWLTRNLKYPPQAQERKQQGKVLVEFIVNKDGSVTNVKVVKSLTPLCDRETLRVMQMMPRWTAGVMDGKPCRTKVCIPIVFKL